MILKHGNVWECTADWFSKTYYSQSPIENPMGPEQGTHHVLRGGLSSLLAKECYCSFRGEAPHDAPDKKIEITALRSMEILGFGCLQIRHGDLIL